jgi:hypothetical protein
MDQLTPTPLRESAAQKWLYFERSTIIIGSRERDQQRDEEL